MIVPFVEGLQSSHLCYDLPLNLQFGKNTGFDLVECISYVLVDQDMYHNAQNDENDCQQKLCYPLT